MIPNTTRWSVAILSRTRFKMPARRLPLTENRTVRAAMCAGTCCWDSDGRCWRIIGHNRAPKGGDSAPALNLTYPGGKSGIVVWTQRNQSHTNPFAVGEYYHRGWCGVLPAPQGYKHRERSARGSICKRQTRNCTISASCLVRQVA